jgi:glucokinase
VQPGGNARNGQEGALILAGDIGGTNTRLALFDGSANAPRAVVLEVFPSKLHAGPEEILQQFLAGHPYPVGAAALGIPGAVRNGRVETPNLPWIVDSASVAGSMGLPSVTLLNDLEANAHGIAVLGASDLTTLNEGIPDPFGNRALISAGTGLGEAGLLAERGHYRPYPSEGGHADFAPRDELQIELLRYLLKQFDHVSYERVLSGPGLHTIYRFLRDTQRAEEPAWLAEEMQQHDPAAIISGHALKGDAAICETALDVFAAIFAAEAGNLALKALATGGVYVGGGIAPKILPKLQEPLFLAAFRSKGRLGKLLEAMPIHVILNDKTALLGAARVAFLTPAGQRDHEPR